MSVSLTNDAGARATAAATAHLPALTPAPPLPLARYIVIAPNGDNDGWCVAQYKDQLRGIDIAYEKRSHFPYVVLLAWSVFSPSLVCNGHARARTHTHACAPLRCPRVQKGAEGRGRRDSACAHGHAINNLAPL